MRLCNWFWSMNHEWKCCVSLAAAAAKSLQSCPTLCDPIYGSPPGSPVPGILQARILEWVAISFSNAWNWKVKMKSFSRIWLLATPWTAAHQAPPSMGFSRQEYWSGVLLPSPVFHLRQSIRELVSDFLASPFPWPIPLELWDEIAASQVKVTWITESPNIALMLMEVA